MRLAGRIALWTFAAIVIVLAGGLAALQSGPGKVWLAGMIADRASSPGAGVRVGAISGFVPFDIRVDRIALTDAAGPWLEIEDAALAWSPSALLRGRLKIDRLTAAQIAALRQPATQASQANAPTSGFTLPRLPVGIELDRLEIGKLVAGPALGGGADGAAAVAAHGFLAKGRADLALRLTRIDGQPGSGAIVARYDQAADALDLDVDIDEPTGVLMDALLGRADRLPLRVTLKGGGPLDGWKGRLVVAAGDALHVDTGLAIDHTGGTRVALNGSVAVSSLLPENARGLVGDTIDFEVTVAASGARALMLAPSRIVMRGATVTAQGGEAEDGALSGTLTLAIPDAGALDPLIGSPARGALALDAVLSGAADHPRLALTERGALIFGRIGVDGVTLNAKVDASAAARSGDPRFAIDADGAARNLHDAATGRSYGDLALHLAGAADADGTQIDIAALAATGAGIDLSGHGSLKNGRAEGAATLKTTDIAVVGGIIGQPLAGAATIDLVASTDAAGTVTAQAKASGEGLRTGVAVADALLAGTVTLDAGGTRMPNGKLTLDHAALASARARVEGAGAFSPADGAISADIKASLADLSALSGAVSSPLAGRGALTATIAGALDAPSLDAEASLDRLAFGAVRIDHLDADIKAPQGWNGIMTVAGRIRSGKLDETIDAALDRPAPQLYRLGRLRLSGTGGAADGALTLDLAGSRAAGRLDAKIGDLSVWSGATGQTLAGQLAIAFDLPAGGRQGPVRLGVDRLAFGVGPDSIAVAHAALTGQAAGDWGKPAGVLDLTANGVAAGGVAVASADAHVAAVGKTVDFRVRAAGRSGDPFTASVAGSADRSRGTKLTIASLAGSLGANTVSLARPLAISLAPGVIQVAGLDLSVDGGSLQGDAALSANAVSANLRLVRLPLHPLALLAGKPFVAGTADGTLTLSGTARRPDARLALTTTGLDLETDGPRPRPALNLAAKLDWRGERAAVDVRLGTGTGEALTLTGSAPFAFDLASFAGRRAADPSLALKLTGGGRIENLTSIAPLGEDRMSGAFTVDVAVGGTIAAPNPSGRVAITGGKYANMALGTEIAAIDLLVTGRGERFVLDHLTATDGASGTLSASGAVDLGAKPVTVGLDLGLTDFRVAHSDDATVNADGKLSLSGTTAGMTASGGLTIRHAELYIPDRLPSSVVTIDVVEVGGGRKAASTSTAPAPQSPPLAPIALDMTLDAPGQVFVRGHGLTSEWRAHIDIGGSSAAPSLVGRLSVLNGSLSLLGQTFNLDRGDVSFGGTDLNPVLDVQASDAASGITALVNVTGTAHAPKIALSSTPVLPQDEILARVLFGQDVGALTASQGLQLAAAAATLTQGGPGIIDKVRSKIGLDRLDIGSGGSNPNGTQGTAQGTTVSGGKYIADGVLVGVSQGLTANSTQAQVQVEITPHISVNSTFGTATGSGFGAKYSVDY